MFTSFFKRNNYGFSGLEMELKQDGVADSNCDELS
jgi:hypothetical protein